MATLGSPRRYYLAKRQAAAALEDDALAAVWRGKQEAEPGTALPTDFTLLSRLECAGYTTLEDLDGADECELVEDAGLTVRQALAVLAAFATLS